MVIREEKLFDDDDYPRWAEHPRVGEKANLVALPLFDIFDREFYPHDPENTGPDLIVGLTSPVSIVGYPFGLRGGLSSGLALALCQ